MGYYALPILYGEAGREARCTADRTAGVLRITTIHKGIPFSKAMTQAVSREIRDLARWLQMDLDPPTFGTT